MVGRALTSEGSFLARLGIGSPGHNRPLVIRAEFLLLARLE